jgi:hypothetical protein
MAAHSSTASRAAKNASTTSRACSFANSAQNHLQSTRNCAPVHPAKGQSSPWTNGQFPSCTTVPSCPCTRYSVPPSVMETTFLGFGPGWGRLAVRPYARRGVPPASMREPSWQRQQDTMTEGVYRRMPPVHLRPCALLSRYCAPCSGTPPSALRRVGRGLQGCVLVV